MCSCQSILECCVTFSGVKFSIRSFVLFIINNIEITQNEQVDEDQLLNTDIDCLSYYLPYWY